MGQDIDIRLDGEDERKLVDMKVGKDRKEKAPLYMDGESVKGIVSLSEAPSILCAVLTSSIDYSPSQGRQETRT